MVQWLGLHTSAAGAWVQFLVGELRSHELHSMAKKRETLWSSQLLGLAEGLCWRGWGADNRWVTIP